MQLIEYQQGFSYHASQLQLGVISGEYNNKTVKWKSGFEKQENKDHNQTLATHIM